LEFLMAAECASKPRVWLALQPPPALHLEILPAQFLSRLQAFPLVSNASAHGRPGTASSRGLPAARSNLSCPTPTAYQWSPRPASCIRPTLFPWPGQQEQPRLSAVVSSCHPSCGPPEGTNFHHSLSWRLRRH